MKKIRIIAAALIFVMILSTVFAVFAADKGDLDDNGKVDSNDAIYLLYHVFFPEDFPVNQNVDFDSSGSVDSNDAIYLLYHVFFSEDYPLGGDGFAVGTDTQGEEYGEFVPFNP